jgi:CHAD domain-containing protein
MARLLAEIARAALANSARELLRCDAMLRLGGGAEGVHGARVAVRRMRSDLRSFEPFLDHEWARSLREEMRWIGDALGAVRDADILVQRLEGDVEALPDADRTPAYLVLGSFRSARDAAHAALHTTLHEARYAELLARVVTAGRYPVLGARAGEDARDGLADVLAANWKGLRKTVRSRTRPATDAQLHAIRIRAKRVRYAAEAAEPAWGAKATRFAHRLERLQSVLGEHHDAVAAEASLRALGGGPHALLAGELVVIEAASAAKARQQWRAAWKRVAEKQVHFWMR